MCGIALLPHHRASLAPPSTNNCAFGHDFREAALTNTGRPWPDSHRKVVRSEEHTSELQSRLHLVSLDRKSTRLNSSHGYISYAVFCLKKKKTHDAGHYLNLYHPIQNGRTPPGDFIADTPRPAVDGTGGVSR